MVQILLSALMPSRAAKLAGGGSLFDFDLSGALATISAKGTKHASIQAKKVSSVSRNKTEAIFSQDVELFAPATVALAISRS